MDIWTCQESEPAKAYQAFQRFLDLGPGRSVKELARMGELDVQLRQLQRYASEYNWIERARAWDNHCFGLSRKVAEDEVLKMTELHAKASRELMEKGLERLRTLEMDRISPADVARFIIEGIKAERLARGLTTDATSINGRIEHDPTDTIRALQDPAVNDAIDNLLAQIDKADGYGPILPGRIRPHSQPGKVETGRASEVTGQ